MKTKNNTKVVAVVVVVIVFATRESRRKHGRINAVEHWKKTSPFGHNVCFHCDFQLNFLLLKSNFQILSCAYKRCEIDSVD